MITWLPQDHRTGKWRKPGLLIPAFSPLYHVELSLPVGRLLPKGSSFFRPGTWSLTEVAQILFQEQCHPHSLPVSGAKKKCFFGQSHSEFCPHNASFNADQEEIRRRAAWNQKGCTILMPCLPFKSNSPAGCLRELTRVCTRRGKEAHCACSSGRTSAPIVLQGMPPR